ncbi:hypothetical protein HOF92_00940, partial [bacterium]|nr:hypothetical protein [bacterium]
MPSSFLSRLFSVFLVVSCFVFLSFGEEPGMEGLSTPVNSQDVQENKESPDATLSEDTGSEPPKSGLQKGRFYNPDAANKKAVIIRAGKIAIPPTAQLLASNMKKAFSGIPSTQKTIDNFTKKYL